MSEFFSQHYAHVCIVILIGLGFYGMVAKRNLVKNGLWDLIWLGSAEHSADLVGKSFAEIGELRGQDPHDAVLDILLEEEARPWMGRKPRLWD